MKKAQLPTQAEIKELLHYDPETGVFRWRVDRAMGRIKPWSIAGGPSNKYWSIYVCKKTRYAHRLAWLYMTGKWPDHEIDHIDRVRTNNSWNNLRPATHKQNMENQPVRKNNTSGFRNVYWYKKNAKWRVVVQHNGRFFTGGFFDDVEKANQAAIAKRAELFTHNVIR